MGGNVCALQRSEASTRKLSGIVSWSFRIRSAIASPTFGAIPKPILKPPLAMKVPGRSGSGPSMGARLLARGRTPAHFSRTLASAISGTAARARVSRSSRASSVLVASVQWSRCRACRRYGGRSATRRRKAGAVWGRCSLGAAPDL